MKSILIALGFLALIGASFGAGWWVRDHGCKRERQLDEAFYIAQKVAAIAHEKLICKRGLR